MKTANLFASVLALATTAAAAVAQQGAASGPRPVLARNVEGRLDRRWCYPVCCCAESTCTGTLCDATQDPLIFTSYCCEQNLENVSLPA